MENLGTTRDFWLILHKESKNYPRESHGDERDSYYKQVQDVEVVAAEGPFMKKCTISSHL